MHAALFRFFFYFSA
ncbi:MULTISPECIES: pheST operon leader peptide PheM [Enterobacterales]|nr:MULTISPECIES: pheST operon leader peptide PheM [Enterobacterales]MBH1919912.1 pheST operon leader peptide PheM [Serratia surfactantfaciens]MBH2603060.1 pheST operon leader peptide PheM [Serratia marcescens]MBH2668354.1 pheST operon leader peptide PheM [Serratia marcescens]MBH2673249.1 pheST operon leader peptide PheM [Serratia marcescens]MBH2891117.1 pheST operon leader peptide PheM [Serratia marcescens]